MAASGCLFCCTPTNKINKAGCGRNQPGGNRKNARKQNNLTSGCAKLSVVQINLHRDKKAWPNVVSQMIGKKLPIILAQEPYTISKRKHRIPNIHKDLIPFYFKSEERSRVSIHVHKTLKESTWELTQFSTRDLVAIKIRTDRNKELILASSYMDGLNGSECPPNEIKPLVNYAKQQNLPLIISSDANARHFMWGNTISNARGDELLDYLELNDLTWSNVGSTPTFDNNRWQAIIDLTIVNKQAENLVSNWRVSDEPSLSDHNFIFFEVEHPVRVAEPKRLSKNTNWDGFIEDLSKDANLIGISENPPVTKEQLDRAAKQLQCSITTAIEANCPLTYIPNSLKDPPWFTREIREAKGAMKNKLMRARTSKLDSDWKKYRAHAAKYKKDINKSKTKEWRKFCADSESIHEKARISKVVKSDGSQPNNIQSVYKQDKTITKSPNETLDRMAEVHFGSQDQNVTPHVSQPSVSERSDGETNCVFSEDRLRQAIRLFEPGKAPGLDGIQAIHLQKGWEYLHTPIQTIMKTSHNMGHVPVPWRESKGIFLSKPGKSDYLQPKAYRVITLTPVLLKLQERVILWHMQEDLKVGALMSNRQYGFKRGNSTVTALHKAVHRIEKAIASKGYALGTFLDIEGAFDNVSFQAIREALTKSKIDKNTSEWIMNMISNRFITLEIKNHKKRIRINRGCPQGGILSPFLWNLVVDDLLKHIEKNDVGNVQAFADDLLSLVCGSCPSTLRDITQRSLGIIERWCEAKGLKVSAIKTKVVMFTWNTKWSIRALRLSGETLELSPTVKFLGITLDSKLSFKPHIENITRKATTILFQCRKAVGPTWGLTPQTCRWIYTAVVRPVITYGVSIWIRALTVQQNQALFRKMQRRAMILATGALPSTPSITLNRLNNIPDIIDYLEGEAANNALRLTAYGSWTREILPDLKGTITSHSKIIDTYIKEKVKPPKGDLDLTTPITNLERNFSIEIPDRTNVEQIINENKSSISCYTDGSKSESGTGYGYHISHDEKCEFEQSSKLPNYCTVYQAEMSAIASVTGKLLDDQTTNKKVTIFTDSQASLYQLQATYIRTKTAISCLKGLRELGAKNEVKLVWIPGHMGYWGNEKADELAKKGAEEGEPVNGFIPHSHLKGKIKNYIEKSSGDRWNEDNAPRVSKQTIDNNKVKEFLKLNRKDTRLAVQILSGHAALNQTLYNYRCVDSPICPHCGDEPETVEHFIGTCPYFTSKRKEYLQEYYTNITTVCRRHSLKRILRFVKKTGRLKHKPKDAKT